MNKENSYDVADEILQFTSFRMNNHDVQPSVMAEALLYSFSATIATFSEPEDLSEIIKEATEYLVKMKIMKNGKIHSVDMH